MVSPNFLSAHKHRCERKIETRLLFIKGLLSTSLLPHSFLTGLEYPPMFNIWPYSYMAKISSRCFQPFGIFGLCEGIIKVPWEDELSSRSDMAKLCVLI